MLQFGVFSTIQSKYFFCFVILRVFGSHPVKQAPKAHIDDKMLPQAPRHTIQILRRENCPYEEMCSKHRTSSHHEEKTTCDKDCMQSQMLEQELFAAISPEAQEHEIGG